MTVLLQGFNWNSHKHENHYIQLKQNVKRIKSMGIRKLWLPPSSKSKDKEGYNPVEYYDFSSEYGTKTELQDLIKYSNDNKIDCIADIVCWRCFGNYCRQYYKFNNREVKHNDPMLFQEFTNYCRYLTEELEYKGLRFDYIKEEHANRLCKYIVQSGYFNDTFIVGELWDALSYDNTYLHYDQNNHRKDIVNYIDNIESSVPVHMFDFTTKGILQEAITKNEYWRLKDHEGKPPGVAGWWPERAVTFVDNHDTLGQFHWSFSFNCNDVIAGYVYIFTHPGNPCIYCDHFDQYYDTLLPLVQLHNSIQPQKVNILIANDSCYFACINDSIYVVIGDNYGVLNGKQIFSYGISHIYEKF
jgi:alpha-amylase